MQGRQQNSMTSSLLPVTFCITIPRYSYFKDLNFRERKSKKVKTTRASENQCKKTQEFIDGFYIILT